MNNKKYISNSGSLIVKEKSKGVYYLYDLNNKRRCFINESLKIALNECTGDKNLEDIVKNLEQRFLTKSLNEKLPIFLRKLEEQGFVVFNIEPNEQIIRDIKLISSPPLDTIYLEITKSCNQKCIHCYNGAIFGKKSTDLSHKELKNLIDQCEELGVIDFVITGGEPLIYPNLLDILSILKEKRIDFSLFTNGVLLNMDIIKELRRLNPEYVAVSIDSLDEDIYSRIRGSNSLEKVLKNISLMIDKDIRVRTNTSIFKGLNDDQEQISDLVDKLKQMGVGAIVIDGVMSYGRANKKYIPELETIEKIKNAYKFSNEIKVTDSHNDVLSRSELRNNFCGIGTSFLYVLHDGNIALCPVLSDKEFIAGNIRNLNLRSLWENSKIFQEFRKHSYKDIEKCSKCEISPQCLGGCKAKALMYFGNFQAPDLWSCHYNSQPIKE